MSPTFRVVLALALVLLISAAGWSSRLVRRSGRCGASVVGPVHRPHTSPPAMRHSADAIRNAHTPGC